MKFLLVAIVLMILGLTTAIDLSNPCPKKCNINKSLNPVCVQKDDGSQQTVPNESFVRCAKSCNKNWSVVHAGKC
uniref:Venom polypeptide n=1 Tax=Dolopus genitalis TaxID=2488630 RepID=A0A3G5BIE2_DOLGE|nr:venom polypeptide [Dolopus genitalis]